jgi:ubiquinone/menaquinone biosynthesis C-methylase UbiE
VSILHRLVTWNQHTCPWWLCYTFDNPLRRYVHDAREIFRDLVSEGDVVLDLGCGLGYFTLALAELVGASGRVVAVDVQSEMLSRARRRAERRGLAARIQFHHCAPDAIGLSGQFDFALSFWMLHEVRHRRAFLAEVRSLLVPGRSLLVAEPKGHVSARMFAREIEVAAESGFVVQEGPRVRLSRSAVCLRPVTASAT